MSIGGEEGVNAAQQAHCREGFHALRHLPLVCIPCGNTLPRVELALEEDAHSCSTRAIVAATNSTDPPKKVKKKKVNIYSKSLYNDSLVF